jgi:DNA-binding MurR/RpiR family transcriptional regulator
VSNLRLRAVLFPASVMDDAEYWTAISQALPSPNCVIVARGGSRYRRMTRKVAATMSAAGARTIIVL